MFPLVNSAAIFNVFSFNFYADYLYRKCSHFGQFFLKKASCNRVALPSLLSHSKHWRIFPGGGLCFHSHGLFLKCAEISCIAYWTTEGFFFFFINPNFDSNLQPLDPGSSVFAVWPLDLLGVCTSGSCPSVAWKARNSLPWVTSWMWDHLSLQATFAGPVFLCALLW